MTALSPFFRTVRMGMTRRLAGGMSTVDGEIKRMLKSDWEAVEESDPDGAGALRKACEKALAENATKIAEGMARKAAEGNVLCGRFLDDRAAEHREKREAQSRKPKRSLATEWASEPEWTEEDEAAAKAEQSKTV